MRRAAARPFVSLPEAANIVLADNRRYPEVCVREAEDGTLVLCRDLAARHRIHLHAGSLLIRQDDGPRI